MARCRSTPRRKSLLQRWMPHRAAGTRAERRIFDRHASLDNGALGIVVPHVDTADEAREVVQKLKYPPIGHRSMGGTGPHYSLRSASTGDAAKALNAANLTVVMLETPTAINNADAIAAVPGVDVLLIG